MSLSEALERSLKQLADFTQAQIGSGLGRAAGTAASVGLMPVPPAVAGAPAVPTGAAPVPGAGGTAAVPTGAPVPAPAVAAAGGVPHPGPPPQVADSWAGSMMPRPEGPDHQAGQAAMTRLQLAQNLAQTPIPQASHVDPTAPGFAKMQRGIGGLLQQRAAGRVAEYQGALAKFDMQRRQGLYGDLSRATSPADVFRIQSHWGASNEEVEPALTSLKEQFEERVTLWTTTMKEYSALIQKEMDVGIRQYEHDTVSADTALRTATTRRGQDLTYKAAQTATGVRSAIAASVHMNPRTAAGLAAALPELAGDILGARSTFSEARSKQVGELAGVGVGLTDDEATLTSDAMQYVRTTISKDGRTYAPPLPQMALWFLDDVDPETGEPRFDKTQRDTIVGGQAARAHAFLIGGDLSAASREAADAAWGSGLGLLVADALHGVAQQILAEQGYALDDAPAGGGAGDGAGGEPIPDHYFLRDAGVHEDWLDEFRNHDQAFRTRALAAWRRFETTGEAPFYMLPKGRPTTGAGTAPTAGVSPQDWMRQTEGQVVPPRTEFQIINRTLGRGGEKVGKERLAELMGAASLDDREQTEMFELLRTFGPPGGR